MRHHLRTRYSRSEYPLRLWQRRSTLEPLFFPILSMIRGHGPCMSGSRAFVSCLSFTFYAVINVLDSIHDDDDDDAIGRYGHIEGRLLSKMKEQNCEPRKIQHGESGLKITAASTPTLSLAERDALEFWSVKREECACFLLPFGAFLFVWLPSRESGFNRYSV